MALCLSAALLGAVDLAAQTWNGSSSTTWSTAGNWTGGVPGAAATATFNANTANDPNLTAAATVGKLLFSVGTDAETFTGSALTLNGVSSLGIDNQSGVTQTFSNTLVVGAAQTWNASSGGLTFAQVTVSNNLTLTGSTTFAFGGTFLLNGGNRTLTNNSTGTVTLSGGVTGNTRTLTVAGTGDTSITGAIATTTGGLIKTGTGTLSLSGANTYTGATTVGSSGGTSGGTLRSGASNVLSGGTTTVYAGTLDLNGNSDTIGALTLGGGATGTTAAVTTGAGTLTLGGNVTYTATNNPNGATVSGNLNLGGATRTFTIGDSTNASADLTIDAALSGGGGVTKQGLGTLVLSGANTYTGATSVSAGILNIRNSSALGSTAAGTTVTTGEELQLQGGIAVGAEALSITGTGTTTGALVNISDTNSYAGVITLAGNTTFSANAGSLTLSGGVTGTNRNLIVTGAGDTTISGNLTTGSGTLTKTGSGTLTLSGTNTYTGATTINAGTLSVGTIGNGGVSGNLGAATTTATNLTLGGGTLQYTGATASTNRNFVLTAGTTSTIDVANVSTNLTVSGASTNTTGGLIKEGAGTLTLSGTNLYTGATTVNAGTLALGASNVLSNSTAVTVASGATLDINSQSETIASLAGGGDVSISSGSLTTAGNASTTFSGTLTGNGTFTKQGTGTLTLDNSFNFDGVFNLAGGTLLLSNAALTLGTLNVTANSVLDFSGVSSLSLANFSISGGVTLTIQNWANASDYFFAQNWSGAAFDTTGAAPMNQITFSTFTANDTKWLGYENNLGSGYHQITPVPEPSAYGALLLAAGLAFGLVRRWVTRRAG